MNEFLPIKDKKIGILGAGQSGIAAAKLAYKLGANVFVSDINKKNKINFKEKIQAEFGCHSNKILDSDFIIKSPGISRKSKIMKEILDSSMPIVSELEFASWFTESFIIALTGTNGKTTTVELINKILNEYGLKTFLGGNIGIPFSANVLEEICNKNNKQNNYHILEVSSFQLEDIKYFKPNIAVILNIKPDHLDRYDSFSDYYDTKLNIIKNQDQDCYIVINKYIDINQKYNSHVINFFISNEKIFINDLEKTIDLETIKLIGNHNFENITAASIVSDLCGVNEKSMINTINNFIPLPHRLEKINIKSNKNYYNDSKATNLSSTIAALESVGDNVILILGGIDKNLDDFTNLKKYKNKIKHIVLYGLSRDRIKNQICSFFSISDFRLFKNAIKKSIELSNSHDNILFSPACASFDQFKNYKERGNSFKEIILEHYDAN